MRHRSLSQPASCTQQGGGLRIVRTDLGLKAVVRLVGVTSLSLSLLGIPCDVRNAPPPLASLLFHSSISSSNHAAARNPRTCS